MITINVEPAKQRFGKFTKRKQWKYTVTTDNNKPISDRDTYANAGEIREIWERIVESNEAVQMVIHYQAGPKAIILRAAP